MGSRAGPGGGAAAALQRRGRSRAGEAGHPAAAAAAAAATAASAAAAAELAAPAAGEGLAARGWRRRAGGLEVGAQGGCAEGRGMEGRCRLPGSEAPGSREIHLLVTELPAPRPDRELAPPAAAGPARAAGWASGRGAGRGALVVGSAPRHRRRRYSPSVPRALAVAGRAPGAFPGAPRRGGARRLRGKVEESAGLGGTGRKGELSAGPGRPRALTGPGVGAFTGPGAGGVGAKRCGAWRQGCSRRGGGGVQPS